MIPQEFQEVFLPRAQHSKARTCSRVRGLPSIAVEVWPLRVRVSFCNAGIHDNSTVAPTMRSRRAAIRSTSRSRRGLIVNCGWKDTLMSQV